MSRRKRLLSVLVGRTAVEPRKAICTRSMGFFGMLTISAATTWGIGAPAVAEEPYELKWWEQFGSPGDDFCKAVALDAAGNAHIAGDTDGDLFGPTAGSRDAFVAKFDDAGAMLWSRQFGTTATDRAAGVAVDAGGNVYVCGSTSGDLGGPSAGSADAYLAKFDESGELLWSVQVGTPQSDAALAMAIDSGGDVYISGYTRGDLAGPGAGDEDVFLAKIDPLGDVIWMRQFGSPEFDGSSCVAVDGDDNVYLSGGTGQLATRDLFLAKYDSAGNQMWLREFSVVTQLHINAITVDSDGSAYLAGSISTYDVFLAKYDTLGNQLWTRQFGTPHTRYDAAEGIALDSAGDLLVCGSTDTSLGGPHLGFSDMFLAKYDPAGRLLWIRQFGTSIWDDAQAIAIDGEGNAYISGEWREDPFATIADVVLAKLGPASDPCYADCDRSGELDFLDLLCFQSAFVLEAAYADCDDSGAHDFFDFLCFQNAFAAGCP